jgi:hypothetical protein
MQSWKSKKLRDEKRKARRKERQAVAHALRSTTGKYPELKYKGDIILKKKTLSFRQRLADKLKALSFRSIFKK